MMRWFCRVRCGGRWQCARHLFRAHVRFGRDRDRLPRWRLDLRDRRPNPVQAGHADHEGCGCSRRNRPSPERRKPRPASPRPACARDGRILRHQALVKLRVERGRNLYVIQGSDQCNRLPEGVHFCRATNGTAGGAARHAATLRRTTPDRCSADRSGRTPSQFMGFSPPSPVDDSRRQKFQAHELFFEGAPRPAEPRLHRAQVEVQRLGDFIV